MEWTYKAPTVALGHVSLKKFEKKNNDGMIRFISINLHKRVYITSKKEVITAAI